jgi:hypothetical protein
MRRTQAEIIGRGIQIQNYAYAVHDEAFESLIRRMEKEMHQKSRAGLGNREGPPNKCFSVALFMPE